jgi:DNA-binding SARP family transcriptional activator/tetratricopeptide (TPR) repeat protein
VTHSGGTTFRVLLLGSVEVQAGALVVKGPPQQQLVVAALAVDAGRPVAIETLIDRVWDAVPDGARRTLYVLVTRIRRRLEESGSAGARLLRESGGYVLTIDPDRVDVHQFRATVERSRDRGLAPRERAALLDEAIAMWRGEPLTGLPGQWAARTREAWRHEYLDAVVAWAQAHVELGDPGSVIGHLSSLAAENPLVEPLAATLLRALHAAGRSAEALREYPRIRRRLVDELGTEPGPELRATHRAILAGDASEAGDASGPRGASGGVKRSDVPSQLPADTYWFVGRDPELAGLDRLLASAPEQAPTAVVVYALSGPAGVGKSALAVHWAHRVAHRFPDGQFHANLRGFDPSGPPARPEEILRRFLAVLDVPPQRMPADLDALAALYRTRMAGRRMLVVLDNARDTAHVRPLLPGTPTCLVLVTSRSQLTGLVADGAHPVTLDLLSDRESRALLARRLGADRVARSADAVREIVARCDRLPLALTIVAARAAINPQVPLRRLADELDDARQRFGVLTGDDPTVDLSAVFSWSYRTLGDGAARLFRLIGLPPTPDLTEPVMASLMALPRADVRPLLAALTERNLIVQHSPGRYTCHDLLRAYAADMSRRTDPEAARRATLRRLLSHYVHSTRAAASALEPSREWPEAWTPDAGVEPEAPDGYQQALDWFDAEHRCLLAAVECSAAAGFDAQTWQLVHAMVTFLDWRGHWHEWLETSRLALEAARRLGESARQVSALRSHAAACIELGRVDDARDNLHQALEILAAGDDTDNRAHCHHLLAYLSGRAGDDRQALRHGQVALDLYRAAGNVRGVAHALNTVGWHHARLEHHDEALAHCRLSLEKHIEVGDRWGEAGVWDSLGFINHAMGDHDEAVRCYRRALALFTELGDQHDGATAWSRLGDVYQSAGDRAAAVDAWQRGLSILAELDHPDADALRAKLTAVAPAGG